jgi:ABC-type phosphate transport system substrate-binding protein
MLLGNRRLFMSLLILTMMLTACSRAPTATALPETVEHIAVTPAFKDTVIDWLEEYSAEYGPLPFDLEVLPQEAALADIEEGKLSLIISSVNPPPGWFATPLAIEGIAVIVHPDNSIRDFSQDQLQGLFSGCISTWAELGGPQSQVQPAIPPVGDEIRELFDALITANAPPPPWAIVAPTPSTMLEFVRDNPSAIGYIPFSQAFEDIRVVRIEGILPGQSTFNDGRYPLWFSILAFAPEEPEGPIRQWLAWQQVYFSIASK